MHDGIQFLVLARQFAVQLLQHLGSLLELVGALSDSAFQFAIEGLELVGLAMQFREDAHFGTAEFRNDRKQKCNPWPPVGIP